MAYAATGLFQPSTSSPSPTPSAYLQGIDVSHYQGTIDWSQVPGAGKRFAIMEVTLGQTYVDPTYAANHAAARAAGLPVAAYHYAKPSSDPNDAILQADWYAENAALLPGDLVPALDLEETGGLSVAALQVWVGAWLGEVYAKLGVRPMIYTDPTFWADAMGDTSMFADQGYAVLWVAYWFTSDPPVPGNTWGGHGWTFWQYSNCGYVTGISGCVDLDWYNGMNLSALAFHYTYVPPPPAGPPALAGITPATAPAGGGDLTITIEGTNFASGVSIADWNGTPLATTYVSPTQLTAVVPAALSATPGTSSVTVRNQPPGAVSGSIPFTVTLPAVQVSVAPSTNAISWGQPVTLPIHVAQAGANLTLTLQRMQANESGWSAIGTVTTDTSGHASLSYAPSLNTQFRAVYAGGPVLGAGTSPPVRVVVRQLVVLRPTGLGRVKSVPPRAAVTFTATVRPMGPSRDPTEVTFGFWHQLNGRWQFVTKRDVYVDAQGHASWTWAFTSIGQWYVRAEADPTQTNANSFWSPLERYVVY
ncbi:MAG: GH25 family lysozyme [Candidatus Limnocylindrales bacterium]